MDEFRGQMWFALLLTLLQGYRVQIPCRYSNSYALWNEVHITSVLPPERVYQSMVLESNRGFDTIDQLLRRISSVAYHYKDGNENRKFEVPTSEYLNYDTLMAWIEDRH